jgi:hypothetical protein
MRAAAGSVACRPLRPTCRTPTTAAPDLRDVVRHRAEQRGFNFRDAGRSDVMGFPGSCLRDVPLRVDRLAIAIAT